MGSWFHAPYNQFQEFFSGRRLQAVMVGLDCSGKTTILYKMNLCEMPSIPPIGYNFEVAEFRRVKFTAWDLGLNSRPLYKYFYKDIQAVVFVVDSTDGDRMAEAGAELQRMMGSEELKDVALLVLANKQDLPGLGIEEVTTQLKLQQLKNRKWRIFGSSALTGDGLIEAFDWLCTAVNQKS